MALQQEVSPRPKPPLKVAVGLAVPAIEAWYRCGLDVHCTEARFVREDANRLYTLRRELKLQAYGSATPSLAVLKARGVEHSRRLASSLTLLEQQFPLGFGMLSRSLRKW